MRVERNSQSFQQLIELLSRDEVAIMACDTIYGFVGKAPITEQQIREIKGRGETKPFLLLIADRENLNDLKVKLPEDSAILDLWPGPFTFVFALQEGGTIAVRVPEDERLRDLVRQVGPLYSTSVNRAGEAPLDSPEHIEKEFGQEVALIEDSGVFTGRLPSTVVALHESSVRILRQGAGEVPSSYLSTIL